jgi:NADH dehydrogenase FAD-containing subunit
MLTNSKVSAITVLGAGEAGISFLKKVREKNPAIKLTVIDKIRIISIRPGSLIQRI